MPNGTDASTGTIQCTPTRDDVNANQKREMGTSTPPTCPIRSRNSAGGSFWPWTSLYLWYLLGDGDAVRVLSILFRLDGLRKFAPVPVGLSAQAEDHPHRHSEECQTCALHVEPALSLKYDRKGLECQVEDSQNNRIPVNEVSRASQCIRLNKRGTAHHVFNNNSIRLSSTKSVG